MYYSILWHNNDRACISHWCLMNKLLYDPQAIGCHVRCYDRRRDAGEVDLVRTQSDAETPGLGSTRRYRRSTCCLTSRGRCGLIMVLVCRCDGSRYRSANSAGRPADGASGLVHRRNRGGSVDGGHVCSEREEVLSWAARWRGLRRGVRLVSGGESFSSVYEYV